MLEVEKDPRLTKSDMDKPNENIDVEEDSSRNECVGIDARRVVSSCTLLRKKSKIRSLRSKPPVVAEDAPNKNVDLPETSTNEGVDNDPPHEEEKVESESPETFNEPQLDGSVAEFEDYEKQLYSSSSETDTLQDDDCCKKTISDDVNEVGIHDDKPTELVSPIIPEVELQPIAVPHPFEQVGREHGLSPITPNDFFPACGPLKKSINTKTNKTLRKDFLSDDVSIWEGSRGSEPSDDDEDEHVQATPPQRPQPQSQPQLGQQRTSRNLAQSNIQPRPSSATNTSSPPPRTSNCRNKALTILDSSPRTKQQLLKSLLNSTSKKQPGKEKENNKPKKKTKKGSEKDKLVNHLINSLGRLHGLHSNQFEVEYTVALHQAMLDNNNLFTPNPSPERPQTAPNPTTTSFYDIPPPPLENDDSPHQLFCPWPSQPKSKLSRPKTARASSQMQPSSGTPSEESIKSQPNEWDTDDEQRPEFDQNNNFILPPAKLPPFYHRPKRQQKQELPLPSVSKKALEKTPVKKLPKSPPPPGFRLSTAERLATPKWVTPAFVSSQADLDVGTRSRPTSARSNNSSKSSFLVPEPKLARRPTNRKTVVEIGTQTPIRKQRRKNVDLDQKQGRANFKNANPKSTQTSIPTATMRKIPTLRRPLSPT